MRLLGLGALITAELALVTLSADGANLPQGAGGLIGLLDDWGAWIARWIVASGALFGAIAYFRPGTIAVTGDWTPPSGPWLAIHVACATAFWLLSRSLYSQAASTGLLMAWISTGAGTVATAAAALIPRTAIGPLLRGAAPAMLASALAGAAACWLGAFSQRLWRPAAGATFVIVKGLLGVLVGDVVVEPWRNRVGTQRFGVLIAEECSGLEGIALFLAFAVCWLVLFRDELRIGRALAALPLGVVAVYLANSVRITLLVLIGHAGYRQVAVQGFHSQAGWIGFSLIAFGVLAAARRWSWLSKLPPASASQRRRVSQSSGALPGSVPRGHCGRNDFRSAVRRVRVVLRPSCRCGRRGALDVPVPVQEHRLVLELASASRRSRGIRHLGRAGLAGWAW